MKVSRNLFVLLFLCMLFVLPACSFEEANVKKSKNVLVTRVIDGDTFEVQVEGKLETVRMLGIDTPETKDPDEPVECGGINASEYLKYRLQGKEVTLKTDFTQDEVDYYGRLLAYVYLEDELIQETILEKGLGEVYVFDSNPVSKNDLLETAQEKAQNKNLGIWGEC